MGCAIGTAKYLVFFFNFIFFLSGLLIIIVGGIALSEQNNIHQTTKVEFHSAPVLLIVVGAFVAIIAFLGCCGAIKNNYCMLVTFSIILGLIFILELAAGIAAYVHKNELLDEIEKGLNQTLKETLQDKPDKELVDAWKGIQQEFDCCGVENYTDYLNNGSPIPPSCCPTDAKNETCVAERAYQTGCVEAMKHKLEKNIILIGGIGVGISFIQILGIVCACCLASAVKGSY